MRKALFLFLLALLSYTTDAQIYERMVTARDTLKTKGAFVYQGVQVPVSNISYVQWSSTGVGTPISNPTGWHKTWVMGDGYMSVSSDYGYTWSNAIPQGAEQDPIVKSIVGFVVSNGSVISAAPNSTALSNVSGVNTGDQDLTGLVHANRTALDAVSGVNTGDQDISGKVDKVAGKGLSSNDYTDADSTKVANLSGVNTGDQDLTGLVHSNRTALDSVAGINKGDETQASIKTKLGAASGSADGYITSSDWTTFNGKQNALGYTAENSANKVTSALFGQEGTYTDVQYPSALAVNNRLLQKQTVNSGYISGLTLTINSDNTKYDISAGTYAIVDWTIPSAPVVTHVAYPGYTGKTPSYLTTANATYIFLDGAGNIVESNAPITNAQRRIYCSVGAVIHSNRTNINVTNSIKMPITGTTNQLHDFIKAIGALNLSGNVYGPSGANLSIDKSAGTIFGLGINATDYTNPHQLTINAQTALSFRYRLQNGTEYADQSVIDPNYYDLNSVKTAVDNNKYTVQRINLFQSGLTRIQYGQHQYNTLEDALVAVPTETFVTEANISDNAIFRCYLIIKQGTTNLTTAVSGGSARFVSVDKFGNALGSGGSALTYSAIITALGYTPMMDVAPGTSGNVLTSNGSIWTSAAPSASGVTGSGTIGYVPKFTSTTAIGNSSLFQSGNNILIGTETDNGGKLQVYDATSAVIRAVSGTRQIFFSAMSGDINYNQSIGAPYLLGTSDANPLYLYTNNALRLDLASNGDFNFNSNQMFLQQSTGNLGVGTVSPGARIESYGSVAGAFSALKLWNANGTNGNTTSIDFSGSAAGTVGGRINHYRIGSTAYDLGFSVYTSGALTEQFRIVNTGQIKLPAYTSSTSFSGTATANLAVDASGNVITTEMASGSAWTVSSISTNTTAVKNYAYVVTATLTLTLPAAPSTGDMVRVVDLSGSGTVTLGRNSLKIMGYSEDLVLDKANTGYELMYSGATNGWVIF